MVLKLDEQQIAQESIENITDFSDQRGGGVRTISRLNFLRIGILSGFGLLSWRLWDLQKPFNNNSLDDSKAKNSADNPTPETRYLISKSPRGIIYDRNNKKLVSNTASYSVTLTANYLPDPAKGRDKTERADLLAQRQAVYDNLALFLGMNYYIVLIPEQVNALSTKAKVPTPTNPERNAILNELEVITGVSARDWDKNLLDLAAKGRDKDLYIVNEKEPISITQFDRYKYLRNKFSQGVFFQSDAELKMFQASNFVPAYQPVEVWPQLSREDAMLLTERRLEFPGVNVQINYIRQYQDPRLFSHILGYTGPFASQEDLVAANKEAQGDANEPTNPEDPSNKIDTYAIDDKVGKTGVEGWMEPFLRGRKGANEVKVNSTGHILSTVRTGRPAQPGYNVHLTIDWDLQAAAQTALERQLFNKNATNDKAKVPEGAAVVIDVQTGEVVALVGYPYYNNNLYNKPYKEWTDAEKTEINDEDKAVQVNRAVSARYAPGSCFKLITASAALNEKVVNLGSTFYCNHFIFIPTSKQPKPAQKFQCWGQHGPQTVVDAVKNSCDIFFYNASVPDGNDDLSGRSRFYNAENDPEAHFFHGMGIDVLNGYMALFNVGKKTGIELPGEYSGVLPGHHTKPQWSIGDTMTTSIGQGDVEITPLQICMITACFANGGKLLQPKLVREVRDGDDKVVLPFAPKLIRDVTKEAVTWPAPDPKDTTRTHLIPTEFRLETAVLDAVRQGMLKVTQPGGTAESQMANQMGTLQVAGKTGTAEYGEIIGKDTKGNDARATRAWFTAFAPYDNPRYAVTALIASGGIGTEGSTYAVPVVKEILQHLFPKETGVDKQNQPTPKK